jgi:hypothetical protein
MLGVWRQDLPALRGEVRHVAMKQRDGALEPVPVVIADVPRQGVILEDADFPAVARGRANGVLSDVAGAVKADGEHLNLLVKRRYWIDIGEGVP